MNTLHLPLREIFVKVRLNAPWRTEWKKVMARDAKDAERIAESLPDVKRVYEVSLIPVGACSP